MPYWSVTCIYCLGEIIDALLECVPSDPSRGCALLLLMQCRPGAALACLYCNGLLGFDDQGELQVPQSGWPVFRYGRRELELKKHEDGQPAMGLAEWAARYRFINPGLHTPFFCYEYAEHSPPNETVP